VGPPFFLLMEKRRLFHFVKLGNVVESTWILGKESSLPQEWNDVSQVVFFGENIDVGEQCLPGNSYEGVANPTYAVRNCRLL
jgi:hypothetical protein